MEINDVREPGQFKGETFSKYKKVDVRNQLIQNMIRGKIEPACYWSAELICAGHFMELWETILHYAGKHIHLGNPKIIPYLEMRFEGFRQIIQQGHHLNELQLRNHPTIRRLFAEVIATLTYSERKHSFESIKINRVEEFDMTQMTERLKATSMRYAENIFLKEDPKELYIAINEFCFHLEGKNMVNACYWIEWIMEFETICKQKREKIICERRSNIPVESKCQMDLIWIIWDIILSISEEKPNIVKKIINALLTLFTLKYTSGCHRKRKYILYFACSILCEKINTEEEIIRKEQKEKINTIIKQIDLIYSQIKKNEESPVTDYLFKDVKSRNLEKTIEKLDTLNTFGESFMPRLS
jgi:hypothetical protein